ncbi:MAG TPA: M15 family metallopeptidase, partial [Cyclobacteriaceae bacterium]|nr:M15 family metallopeptidase [Cyclobacteriaceae bacterium]
SNMAKAKVTMPQITIEQPGFIYIFVYNRSNSANWVYFDEMLVTHEHSAIVAGADYYPFGLAMDGREITDEAYRWGYQGQYAEEDSITNWNEFQLRMYDARFGRWLSPDPFGQYWSPYLGMGNAPNLTIDPSGGLSNFAAFSIGFGVGAIGGAIASDGDPRWTVLAAIGGGFAGVGLNNLNLNSIKGSAGKLPSPSTPVPGNLNVPTINLPAIVAPTLESMATRLAQEYHRPLDFPTWDTPTNRRIRELHPRLGIAAREFINSVENELGIQLRITQGFRSIEEQDALYAQGRTTPGEVVTNARGGQSYHNYGLAFDVVEMVNGQANWNTTMQNWNRIGAIAQRFGLEWGGTWTRFVDLPHFQMTFGHTIRELMQIHGVRLGGTR